MGDVACDDFFTGQAAALAGGTTYHIDFALPVDHDLMKGWEAWQVRGLTEVTAQPVVECSWQQACIDSIPGQLPATIPRCCHGLQVKGQQGCMDYSFHMAVTNWNEKVGP